MNPKLELTLTVAFCFVLGAALAGNQNAIDLLPAFPALFLLSR